MNLQMINETQRNIFFVHGFTSIDFFIINNLSILID